MPVSLPRAALRALSVILSLALLAGCGPRGNAAKPIPTALVPAPQPAARLVVVLPGRGDNLAALERSGMTDAIQSVWPDADVLFAELTMAYYLEGGAAQRLHDEVIVPARRRGYREVWLSGASMGGMGALLYDRAYPGDADGLVLLAPYLGDRAILEEITAAGGIARWDAGPPQAINADTWQHEVWRHLQTWARDPDKARNVWLAYGDRDRLRRAMPVLEPLLRPEHILVRPGGHAWAMWSPAMREVLTAASTRSAAGERSR